MLMQTPAERAASRTWTVLGQAEQLRTRFGEESLTDLLMLEMLPHQRARGFWLFSTTKPAEGVCGGDLLVIVRHQPRNWSLLALQAKKLYPNDRYQTLGGIESVAQLGRLERFARQLRAIPLYLLYNHTDAADPEVHWHCPKQFAADQLGCTLVPSWHIDQMIQPWTSRSFDLAHSITESMPWRCVFDCPDAIASLAVPASKASVSEYNWSSGAIEAP